MTHSKRVHETSQKTSYVQVKHIQAFTTHGAVSQRMRSRIILVAHVLGLATFATKVPYLTFSDEMRQFDKMDKEGGNKRK